MKKIYFILLLLISHSAFSQTNFGLVQEIEPTSGMGIHMQVYGNTMFLSKYSTDEVKVYARQTDGSWIFLQTLKPWDKPTSTTINWGFGDNMALNDSSAVVTAVYKNTLRADAGGVYFFRRDANGNWQNEFVFENPTAFSYYGGKNIAINKNKVSVSHNNGYPGFVHIFERNSNGSWAINDTITNPAYQFGGIDGQKVFFTDSVFISMFYNYEDQKVREFRLQPNGNWINTQTLSIGITDYNAYFGEKLSVDGSKMAIGAAYFEMDGPENTSLTSAGKVFIYERINNAWVLQQEITAPTPMAYNYFGRDIIIKDDILLICSSSGVHIYRKVNSTWTLAQTYLSESQNQIGYNVFYENDQIISFGYNGVNMLENLKDCQGTPGGQAQLNSCDICYGGTTGLNLAQSETLCMTTSINTALGNAGISVFPNPFDNQIQIQAPDNTNIVLTDCYGRVLTSKIPVELFDTSHLNSGLYFLIMEKDGEKQVVKILKK